MGNKPDAQRQRKLTPKQRVLKKYPKAECQQISFGTYMVNASMKWYIGDDLGQGNTPQAAWAHAARNL